MSERKKTNVVVLWLIAIGLVLGMVLMFTPNLGLGTRTVSRGEVVLHVNGEQVTDVTVNQVRANPLYYTVTEGEVGADLELLLVDTVISQVVLRQAAASTRVTNAEITAAVNAFREDRGVAGRGNDTAYLALIGSAGFDDAAFRGYMREQLRQQKWEEALIGEVTVTDDEVATFFEAFRDSYRDEERIVGRVLAVADPELANELRTRVLTGESFAELASQHSIERADRAGALGAPAGSSEPLPVGRAALPAAVSNAAFAMRAAGLTQVLSSGGMYWLVQVEEFIPQQRRAFESVAEQVREDALQAKRVGIVSAELERLKRAASVEFPAGSTLSYENYVVATVGGEEITAVDLARATYGDAQVQQFLDPSLAFLITQILKPQILEQLIDQRIAVAGASTLNGEFFGTEAQQAAQIMSFVARDVDADEEAALEYFERNQGTYLVNASAQVMQYEFATFEEAEAFRDAVLAGSTPTDAANAAGVVAQDLGTIRPGGAETAVDAAVFGTNAFVVIDGSNREISDVLFVQPPVQEGGAEAPAGDEVAAEEAGDEAASDDDAAEAEEPELEDLIQAADAAMDAAVENAEAAQQALADAAAEVQEGVDAVLQGRDAGEEEDAGEGDGETALSGAEDAAEAEDAEADAPAERYLVLVAARNPERSRSYEEVADQVHEAVTAIMRQEAQQEWLDEVREGVEVRNLTIFGGLDPFDGIDFSPEEPVQEPADDAAGDASDDGGEPAADDADSGEEPAGDEAADDGDAAADEPAADESAADEDAAAEDAAADDAGAGDADAGDGDASENGDDAAEDDGAGDDAAADEEPAADEDEEADEAEAGEAE